MDYIEIVLFNMYNITKISISIKKLKMVINGKIKKITNDKINELLEITEYWDYDYQGFLLDSEKFTIKLISNNKIKKIYQGNGAYPYNYDDFKKWVIDII